MNFTYSQTLALKCIEKTTGLKYGSKQSLKYLKEVESELSKNCCVIPSTDFNGKCFMCDKIINQ